MKKEILYIYAGPIERWSAKATKSGAYKTRAYFINGYSENGTGQPWVGKRQAQSEAKAMGCKAVFQEAS